MMWVVSNTAIFSRECSIRKVLGHQLVKKLADMFGKLKRQDRQQVPKQALKVSDTLKTRQGRRVFFWSLFQKNSALALALTASGKNTLSAEVGGVFSPTSAQRRAKKRLQVIF